jgi:hypothetical protein
MAAWHGVGVGLLVFVPCLGFLGGASREAGPPGAPGLGAEGETIPVAGSPELSDPTSAAFRRYFVYDDAYYRDIDPTRVHVTRPEARGRRLRALGNLTGYGQALRPFARPLAVRTTPGAPVTFLAPDWGTFPNGRRCITVQADERGVASVAFRFGTMSSYHRVVAHSPEATGWVVFRLEALSDEAWARRQRALEGGAS